MRETLAALDDHDVEVAGVALLVNRSGGATDIGAPSFSLVAMDIATWEADECPLCLRGEPLLKPGTTPGAESS